MTDIVAPDSAPNDAFINGPDPLGDKRLDSPAFLVKTATAQATFRHWNILQAGFDGGVLEISLDGGAFVDILAAGGTFVTTPYDAVIFHGNRESHRRPNGMDREPDRVSNHHGEPADFGCRQKRQAAMAARQRQQYHQLGLACGHTTVTEITSPCNYNFVAVRAPLPRRVFAAK